MTLRNRFNIWLTGFIERRRQKKLFARMASVGRNVFFSGSRSISSPHMLRIGDNTWFGENFFARCEGGLSIGSGVIISRGVEIWTSNHNYNSDDLCSLPYDNRFILKPVSIGDNAWIGSRVTIIPGVTIGEGAVIGATPEEDGPLEVATIAPGVTIGARAVIGPKAMVYNDVEEGGEQC